MADGHTAESSARASKRRGGDDASDLDQLTALLGNTTTNDHDELIALLVSILGVEPSVAQFYLEASQWNPHAAIQFHLQQGGGAAPSQPVKRLRCISDTLGSPSSPSSVQPERCAAPPV